jgi:hypothetical protein
MGYRNHTQAILVSSPYLGFQVSCLLLPFAQMPPKKQRHTLVATSHAKAVDSLRKQRKEVQGTLRTMRAELKKDEML